MTDCLCNSIHEVAGPLMYFAFVFALYELAWWLEKRREK